VLGNFSTGGAYAGYVLFDGANIWVTNSNSNNVTEFRASDGSVLGTFSTGGAPAGLAFDGVNIWVANRASNTVSKF
jgi:DNA-binding beta-propeller fold protein YncE